MGSHRSPSKGPYRGSLFSIALCYAYDTLTTTQGYDIGITFKKKQIISVMQSHNEGIYKKIQELGLAASLEKTESNDDTNNQGLQYNCI